MGNSGSRGDDVPSDVEPIWKKSMTAPAEESKEFKTSSGHFAVKTSMRAIPKVQNIPLPIEFSIPQTPPSPPSSKSNKGDAKTWTTSEFHDETLSVKVGPNSFSAIIHVGSGAELCYFKKVKQWFRIYRSEPSWPSQPKASSTYTPNQPLYLYAEVSPYGNIFMANHGRKHVAATLCDGSDDNNPQQKFLVIESKHSVKSAPIQATLASWKSSKDGMEEIKILEPNVDIVMVLCLVFIGDWLTVPRGEKEPATVTAEPMEDTHRSESEHEE